MPGCGGGPWGAGRGRLARREHRNLPGVAPGTAEHWGCGFLAAPCTLSPGCSGGCSTSRGAQPCLVTGEAPPGHPGPEDRMTRCAVPTGRWPPVAPGSCSSQRCVVPRALVAGPGGGGGARGAAAGVHGPRACVSVCARVRVCAHPRGPRACACTCAGRRRGRGCSLREGSGQECTRVGPARAAQGPGRSPQAPVAPAGRGGQWAGGRDAQGLVNSSQRQRALAEPRPVCCPWPWTSRATERQRGGCRPWPGASVT